MYERNLASKHDRYGDRYVVLQDAWVPGEKNAYEVKVEDGRHNKIGWQWPQQFTGPNAEAEARACANDAWTRLREHAKEVAAKEAVKAAEEERVRAARRAEYEASRAAEGWRILTVEEQIEKHRAWKAAQTA